MFVNVKYNSRVLSVGIDLSHVVDHELKYQLTVSRIVIQINLIACHGYKFFLWKAIASKNVSLSFNLVRVTRIFLFRFKTDFIIMHC